MSNPNFPLNWTQYYIPNFFLGANPYAQEFFGKKFFENSNLSNFIPLSFTCSLDTHKKSKAKGKSLEEKEIVHRQGYYIKIKMNNQIIIEKNDDENGDEEN